MRHFDKVFGVVVRLKLPKCWGDPNAIVEKRSGTTLFWAVYLNFNHHFRLQKRHANMARVDDRTTSDNTEAIDLFVSECTDEDHFDHTIDWLEQLMAHAYNSLSDYQIKLAKWKRRKA